MNVLVQISSDNDFNKMILETIKSYLHHFNLDFLDQNSDYSKADAIICYGSQCSDEMLKLNIPVIEVPHNINDLVPDELNHYDVFSDEILGPGSVEVKSSCLSFSNDLFAFCAGQLYRAEELEYDLYQNAVEARSDGFLGDKYEFFNRPLIDLIFRDLFKWLNNNQSLKINNVSSWLTFDVDVLQKWTWRHRIKHLFLIPAYSVSVRMREWFQLFFESFKSLNVVNDPYFKVPLICDLLDQHPATFFFLGKNRDHLAKRYDISKSPFAGLPGLCLHKNKMVGLHSNPLNRDNPKELLKERETIAKTLNTAKKQGDTKKFANIPFISRQHFLQLEPGKTLTHLSKIGIKVDSSLGFNDGPGFRCGSCFPFLWYDIETYKKTDLLEVPLILADFQMHDPQNFDLDKSLAIYQFYLNQVKKVGGVFTILFHNLYFNSKEYPEHQAFFKDVLNNLKTQTKAIDFGSLKKIVSEKHEA